MDFYTIFKDIIHAGPTVLLPFVIFLFALLFGVKISKAIQSAVIVGTAFAGLKLVVEFMAKNLGPATKAMVTHLGVHLNVIDMGFGTVAGIGWSSPIVPFMVLAIMGVNIILLVLNKTNTLSVDIWNYHHSLTVGALVYYETDNVSVAVAAAACTGLFVYKLSDWGAPLVSKYFKMEGVTTPALSALTYLPIVVPINWVFDRIPGFNKINFDMGSLQKYFGVFGQPIMIGLILGTGIGLLAGYDPYKAFGLGVNMATAMLLLPKMTHMFVDGLKPVSEQARKITNEKFKGRKILIGLDPSILLGDASVITTALLMIPVLIGLAVIIPGNKLLPFADLAAMPYKVALIVALTNGNIFRSLVLATIVYIPSLLFGTWTASVITGAAKAAGLGKSIPAGMLISSLTGTTMPVSFAIFKVFTGNIAITVPMLLVVFLAIWIFVEKKVMPKVAVKDNIVA